MDGGLDFEEDDEETPVAELDTPRRDFYSEPGDITQFTEPFSLLTTSGPEHSQENGPTENRAMTDESSKYESLVSTKGQMGASFAASSPRTAETQDRGDLARPSDATLAHGVIAFTPNDHHSSPMKTPRTSVSSSWILITEMEFSFNEQSTSLGFRCVT